MYRNSDIAYKCELFLCDRKTMQSITCSNCRVTWILDRAHIDLLTLEKIAVMYMHPQGTNGGWLQIWHAGWKIKMWCQGCMWTRNCGVKKATILSCTRVSKMPPKGLSARLGLVEMQLWNCREVLISLPPSLSPSLYFGQYCGYSKFLRVSHLLLRIVFPKVFLLLGAFLAPHESMNVRYLTHFLKSHAAWNYLTPVLISHEALCTCSHLDALESRVII